MHSLFNDKPGLANFVKIGIIAFVVLSVINLYYSIQVNKKLLDKTST